MGGEVDRGVLLTLGPYSCVGALLFAFSVFTIIFNKTLVRPVLVSINNAE